MKDFDSIRAQRIGTEDDRTFRLLGEQFVAKGSVKPEVLTKYENLSAAEGSQTTLEIIDDLILSMVHDNDGAHDRYRALRAREDGEDVLSIGDLRSVVEWLVERQTGHPTGQRSSSSPGRGSTGDGSTDRSSLRAVEG